LQRRVAHHAGEASIVGARGTLFLDQEMSAGGRVRFACLLHAPANQALEVFAGRHRVGPLVEPQATLPSSDAPRRPKGSDAIRIREYAPLCLTGTPAGRGSTRLGVDRRP